VEILRTVKTSLSAHLVSSPAIAALLEPLLLYCNQIRVLASLIIKHHLFTILQAPPHRLTFVPDQNYVSHAFTVARKSIIKDTQKMLADNSYKATLTASANFVLSLFPTPTYMGPVSKSGLQQVFAWMAKQLAENLSTHLSTHSADAARNWLNNQIRAEILAQDPSKGEDGLKKAIKAFKAALNLSVEEDSPHELKRRYEEFDDRIIAITEKEKKR